MKIKHLFYPTAIFLIALIMSCAPSDELMDDQPENLDVSNVTYSSLETEILLLVNNHRAELGLNRLSIQNVISAAAQDHTDYMVIMGELSHDNFGQRHETLVLQANALAVSENVAFGYHSASSVVNAWLSSDNHRANIENNSHTDMGIAVEKNDINQFYITHIFIKK